MAPRPPPPVPTANQADTQPGYWVNSLEDRVVRAVHDSDQFGLHVHLYQQDVDMSDFFKKVRSVMFGYWR